MGIFQSIGVQVVGFIIILLRVYSYVILARVILGLFIQPNNNFMQFLVFLTEPVLAPIRKKLEPLTRRSAIRLDFSPIIVYLIIAVITEILIQIF